MSFAIPFINRDPSLQETNKFMLCMSTFCDGSGQVREKNGGTRPGWRDFERIVEEVMTGRASENKEVFDVIVPDGESSIDYGISVKSKEIKGKEAIVNLSSSGRVYMELSNSPAKFWSALTNKGVTEQDFRKKMKADEVGDTLIAVVESWHEEAKIKHSQTDISRTLDLEKSIFLTISYGDLTEQGRLYQIHAFSLKFPEIDRWEYISDRCLRGYDKLEPSKAIIDWYGLSGGQLKYYPLARVALFESKPFYLKKPSTASIIDKAKVYWPDDWS